jgi:hypothetical protein
LGIGIRGGEGEEFGGVKGGEKEREERERRTAGWAGRFEAHFEENRASDRIIEVL